MRWYYVVNGEPVGPVRTQYLWRIKEKGLIKNDTYVYNSKVLKDWTKFKRVSHLVEDLVKKKLKDSRFDNNRRNRARKRARNYYRNKTKIDESGESDEEDLSTTTATTACALTAVAGHNSAKLGDWIELMDGKCGRVLYIGPVKGKLGQVLGVELSTPTGTCDGTYEGKRYFQSKEHHGHFYPLPYLNKVILNPVATAGDQSHLQSVVYDLNLCQDFDSVSLQLATKALGYSYSMDQIQQAWDTWALSKESCFNPADKLEILLKILEEPINDENEEGKGDPEFDVIQSRWRRFSEINQITSSTIVV